MDGSSARFRPWLRPFGLVYNPAMKLMTTIDRDEDGVWMAE